MYSNPKNKLRILIVLTCIFLSLFIVITLAHSGRTDSNGGHYNHSTGEYHYHTGEYAGRESSSGMPWYTLYIITFLIILFVVLCFTIWHLIIDSLPQNIISNLENAIYNYKNAVQFTNSCNNKLKETQKKAVIPEGYEIGKDGLPKEIDKTDWGESLTIYTVRDGWKLHLNENCCSSLFSYTKNVYSFYNKRYSICKKCAQNYQVPNMEWYIEYLKLDPQRKRYEYAKNEQDKALTILNNCNNDSNRKLAKLFFLFSPSKNRKTNELKNEYHRVMQLGNESK